MQRILKQVAVTSLAGAMTFAPVGAIAAGGGEEILTGNNRKDIIFVILDDVGVDQLSLFGAGGDMPPKMPNLAAIAAAGVRFTNTWAMPQCSPSRAAFFTGRYPVRTGVVNAIVDNHLPQSYLSSFETTLPRVLADAGYTSALVGKYHMGDENDPAGTCAPSTRGFDTFIGNLTPGPPSIDPTAGGVDPQGKQVCGYFQTDATGACYTLKAGRIACDFVDEGDTNPKATPSETCLQNGGIFTPGEACGRNRPQRAAFETSNGYYVWPRVALKGPASPYAAPECTRQTNVREYMTQSQAEDAASWWKKQRGRKMLSLSFNSMHTPIQPAPNDLVHTTPKPPYNCPAAISSRPLINGMLEAADIEIGRFLAEIGLAELAPNGEVIRSLDLRNTTLVVVGDNGSFGGTVRVASGYSAQRSKGFVYETGVRVPLIVAGDVVVSPGRKVDDLVNIVDLFHLFGALAGVDVREAVPPTHILDSKPLLPYLRRTGDKPIRVTNYTELGAGEFLPGRDNRSWPCMIASTCNDVLFPTQDLCEANAGTWYGPGGKQRASSCCAVIDASAGQTIFPVSQHAVRDKNFKIVQMENTNCAAPLKKGEPKSFPWAEYSTAVTYELYDVQKTAQNPTGLDQANANIIKDCGADPTSCLPKKYRKTYDELYGELERVQASAEPQTTCAAKGDGNMDLVVDGRDIAGWESFAGKGPSRYDINVDGVTNGADRTIIEKNRGLDCTKMTGAAKAAALQKEAAKAAALQ
jgi:arylsulfatase A-like enzyme